MTLPPRRVNRQPEGQGAVRVNALEKTLEEFNREQAAKVSATLAQYHARFVEPRLQVIEFMLGILQFRWFRDTILPLYYLPDRYPARTTTMESEPVQEQVLGDSKIVHIDRRASSMTRGDNGDHQ